MNRTFGTVLKRSATAIAIGAALSMASGVGFAAGDDANLEKLGSFKKTNTPPPKRIAQDPTYIANLKKMLTNIKLPDGFKIDVFAVVPDARSIAVSRNTAAVWVGTRKQNVYFANDRDMDNVADTVEDFSPSVKFDTPAGLCYTPDGFLYVAERNRVMMFPAVEYFTEGSDTVAFAVVKQGDLIPAEEESYNHTARACTIGPDNRIYITLGQPFNVSPPEKQDLYMKTGIGGIVSFNRDGGDRKVVLNGLRNSSGLAFNPKDGALWWTDNQVDGMGDETPPGELNKVPVGADGKLVHGLWYGHPYYGGGDVRTGDYAGKEIPKELADKYVKPQVETIAHAADLGMMFYTGDQFPAKYRPVDVQQYVDGSILVSDDKAGAVYRISYQK
ncbi:MAG: sorbosone dehydrogenase [Betaproteobacteria bacterium]|nr:sorbosone dehydrogenase [Betaproteobacteria bacterium]